MTHTRYTDGGRCTLGSNAVLTSIHTLDVVSTGRAHLFAKRMRPTIRSQFIRYPCRKYSAKMRILLLPVYASKRVTRLEVDLPRPPPLGQSTCQCLAALAVTE